MSGSTGKSSHKHEHATCQHEDVKWCRHCNYIFCEDCDIRWHEWRVGCSYGYGYTGIGQPYIGMTTANPLSSQMTQGGNTQATATAVRSHHDGDGCGWHAS